MAKPEQSGPASDGNDKASQSNVLFVDTSLDTHFALLVSDSDTVSDLKKKILYEHPLCFPSIGEIQIHALKVKRRGYFYHLSDSMLVKSAFDGVKKSWFLSVDALKHNEKLDYHIPASNNEVACFGLKSGTSVDRVDLDRDGPLTKISNFGDSFLPLVVSNQNATDNVPAADKYRSGDSGKELLREKDASQQDIVVQENSLINAGCEVPFDMRLGSKEVADEPCQSSSSNISKRSVSKLKRTENLSKETGVVDKHANSIVDKFNNDVDVQCSKSLEETSNSRHHAKGKHKIEMKSVDQGSLKEIRTVPFDSNKGTSKAESSSQHSLGDKQKTNSNLEGLYSEPAKDAHMFETVSSSGKRKKKRKQSSNLHIQEPSAAPASGKVVEEENSGVTIGIKQRDSNGGLGAASVPRQDLQVTTSELCGQSLKEKQSDSVANVGENDKLPESLEHKQTTNSSLDILASEAIRDALPGTDSKKKRKKKSLNPLDQVVTCERSSRKDVEEQSPGLTAEVNCKDLSKEAVPASASQKGVQVVMTSELCGVHQKQKQSDSFHEVGENDKLPPSLDLDMCDTGAGNVQSKNDAFEEEVANAVKELSNLRKDIELSRGENGVEFESDQTDRVEEERGSSHKRDPKAVLSDGAGLVDQKKSGKRERKRKKPEVSVGTPVKSDIQLVKRSGHEISSAEPQKTVNGDHSSYKAKKEESKVSLTKGKKTSKAKTVNTSLLATGQETGDVNGDEAETLSQISKTQEDMDNVDGKMRKKSKKERSSVKSLPDLQRKDEDVGHKDSSDNQREVDVSPKMTNVKPSFGEKLQVGNGSSIQLEGDECAEHMLQPEKKLTNVSGSEDLIGGTPNKTGIEHGKSHEHDIFSAKPHKNFKDDHSNENYKKEESIFSPKKRKEVSKTNAASTSLLATGEEAADVYGDEVQLSQKISKTLPNTQNMDEKMKKKSKKKQSFTAKNLLDLQSKAQDVGNEDPTYSADNQREVEASPAMKNEKQRSGGKSQARNSSNLQLQGSLEKDECAENLLRPEKKLLKVSRSGIRAPRSTKSGKLIPVPEDARRPSVVNDSETSTNTKKKSEPFAVLKSSKSNVHQGRLHGNTQSGVVKGVRTATSKEIGEVVNNLEREKSLLAKSGEIFKDDSSGSSEDEDGLDNSDASTRTPSDNSLSSDYSDGESNANVNSPRNGSNDSKRNKAGGRSVSKLSFGEKSVTLDRILRSSSRYKKAKLTASQSQLEDSESQPVDFVPDSQANL